MMSGMWRNGFLPSLTMPLLDFFYIHKSHGRGVFSLALLHPRCQHVFSSGVCAIRFVALFITPF